jgi:hypothetical protein
VAGVPPYVSRRRGYVVQAVLSVVLMNELKLWALALLFFVGASLIALSCVPGNAFPSDLWVWGGGCLLLGGVWVYLDRRKKSLTAEEAIEKLLLKAVKRYQQTRSLDSVVAEFKADGIPESTLDLIRNAPRILTQLAQDKLRVGAVLFCTGLIVTVGSLTLVRTLHVFAYGAIGVGLAYIIQGTHLKIVARGAQPGKLES